MSNMGTPGDPGAYGGFGTPPGGPRPVAGAPRTTPAPPKKGRGMGRRAPKEDRPVSRRVVNTQKIAALAMAAIVAVLVVVTVTAGENLTYVVRAKTAIPALSTATKDQFEAVAADETVIQPGTYTGASAEEALEKLTKDLGEQIFVQIPIGEKAQITPEFFSRESQLAKPLEADERLVSIPASIANAVAGQIKVGDKVDVIAVIQKDAGKIANVVAQNLEIVSVYGSQQQFDALSQRQVTGDNAEAELPVKPVPGIYVLRAKAQDAIILSAAVNSGDVVLVWRGAQAGEVIAQPVDLSVLIAEINGGEVLEPIIGGE